MEQDPPNDPGLQSMSGSQNPLEQRPQPRIAVLVLYFSGLRYGRWPLVHTSKWVNGFWAGFVPLDCCLSWARGLVQKLMPSCPRNPRTHQRFPFERTTPQLPSGLLPSLPLVFFFLVWGAPLKSAHPNKSTHGAFSPDLPDGTPLRASAPDVRRPASDVFEVTAAVGFLGSAAE